MCDEHVHELYKIMSVRIIIMRLITFISLRVQSIIWSNSNSICTVKLKQGKFNVHGSGNTSILLLIYGLFDNEPYFLIIYCFKFLFTEENIQRNWKKS